MKKYFIVADIHGFYDEMCKALAAAGYDKTNPDHIFVSLGDLLDRGPAANQCLDFVNSLPDENKILIMGNHELLMAELIHRGYPLSYDFSNGTWDSIQQLVGDECRDDWQAIQLMKENQSWKKYYNSLTFYGEVGDNIFVHGWIPSTGYQKAHFKEWEDATWKNGMLLWSQGDKISGKTIWCGHWHTSWGHANLHHYGVEFPKKKGDKAHFSPFKDEGIVAMDACTVYSHKVNCEVITF